HHPQSSGTLTFALCASLVLHALMILIALWWYVIQTPPPKLAALLRPDIAPPIIVKSDEPKPPPPPPPAPPPEPTKQDFANAEKAPLRDDSGEATGHGTANRSTPGDRPMEAAAGLEQANLSRSPDHPTDLDSKVDDPLMPAQAGNPLGQDAVASAMP